MFRKAFRNIFGNAGVESRVSTFEYVDRPAHMPVTISPPTRAVRRLWS
jgi:hypothetical protein